MIFGPAKKPEPPPWKEIMERLDYLYKNPVKKYPNEPEDNGEPIPPRPGS